MSERKLEKFGTQAEKAKILYFFRNGDPKHEGERLVLNEKRIRTLDQLYRHLSPIVKLPTGAVRKIYAIRAQGKFSMIKDMAEFVDGGMYVCVAGEAIKKIQYNIDYEEVVDSYVEPASLEKMTRPGFRHDVKKDVTSARGKSPTNEDDPDDDANDGEEDAAEAGPSSPPTPTSPSRPAVSRSKSEIQKFGTQAEKALFIYVFRNADPNHDGVKIVVNKKKYARYDQFLLELTNKVKLPTGPVRKLCYLNGKSVPANLDVLEDGATYVGVGAEGFKRVAYKVDAETVVDSYVEPASLEKMTRPGFRHAVTKDE